MMMMMMISVFNLLMFPMSDWPLQERPELMSQEAIIRPDSQLLHFLLDSSMHALQALHVPEYMHYMCWSPWRADARL